MSTWTPEPWKVIAARLNGRVFHAESGAYLFEAKLSNAVRLVACVNGCAGLNPAAYRACVNALSVAILALEKEFGRTKEVLAMKHALAASQEAA